MKASRMLWRRMARSAGSASAGSTCGLGDGLDELRRRPGAQLVMHRPDRAELHRAHPACAIAERVQAHPGGDAVEPGLQRRALLEAVQAAPGPDERLLHRVVRLLGRAEHPVAVPGEGGAMPLQLRAVEGRRCPTWPHECSDRPRPAPPSAVGGCPSASEKRAAQQALWSPTPSRKASATVGRYRANRLGRATRRAMRRGASSNSSIMPRSNCEEVERRAAGHPVAVADQRLVDPGSAGVADVVLDAGPRGEPPVRGPGPPTPAPRARGRAWRWACRRRRRRVARSAPCSLWRRKSGLTKPPGMKSAS